MLVNKHDYIRNIECLFSDKTLSSIRQRSDTSMPLYHTKLFKWALKRKLSNLRGVPFDFSTQQDVAEILQVVLDELKGVSLAASQLMSNTKNHSSL